jgi:hypothetical protein
VAATLVALLPQDELKQQIKEKKLTETLFAISHALEKDILRDIVF